MTETRKIRCDRCSGNGVTVDHVESDGGGFTMNEWNEMDDDFREGYMSGRYDKRCSTCNGSGKITIYVRTECDCGKELTQQAMDDNFFYCSNRCADLDYNCGCGKNGCGRCM